MPVVQTLQTYSVLTKRLLWEGLVPNDTGDGHIIGPYPDGSVQVVGTFGGATVAVQGSNDGVTWATLTDLNGNPATLIATGIVLYVARTWMIRVITTGGVGTDVDAYLFAGR